MKAQEALRKIGLLRKIKTENGALATEADNAARLVKALMDRYAIKADDIPSITQTPIYRMTWIYWRDLLHQFGLKLRHFGQRHDWQRQDRLHQPPYFAMVDRAEIKWRPANQRTRLGSRIAAYLPG
jgi:hypothetical protein